MKGYLFLLFVKLSFANYTEDTGEYNLRLVGSSPLHGRLEVLHEGVWGTVCDDRFTHYTCSLVCKQLGYQGGTCLVHDQTSRDCVYDEKNAYEAGTEKIWLDDVSCVAQELNLAECTHSNWGDVNCNHTEDVGCACEGINYCNASRHRIVPLEKGIEGLGVVEVMMENGQWGAVCDDHWDDVDAAVFCRCLGYSDKETPFKAMLLNPYTSSSNELLTSYEGSIAIDGLYCTQEDVDLRSNLYDCKKNVNNPSKCNVQHELAIVKCGNRTSQFKFSEELVTLVECHKDTMVMCVKPEAPFHIETSFAILKPPCQSAAQLEFDPIRGFCYNINLKNCPPLEQESQENFKSCYELVFHTKNHPFFFNNPPSYSGCCVLDTKKKEVETSLVNLSGSAVHLAQTTISPNLVTNSIEPTITLLCNSQGFDELNSLEKSTNSIHIKSSSSGHTSTITGSQIYCKIKADVWHENSYLVAHRCTLETTRPSFLHEPDCNDTDCGNTSETKNVHEDKTSTYKYEFFKEKCPVTELLNMELYNFDSLSWGFSMYLPKFKGYNNINIFCDVFLCHPDIDDKNMCDRSCSSDINTKSEGENIFEEENDSTAFEDKSTALEDESTAFENESIDSKNENSESAQESGDQEYPALINKRSVRNAGSIFRRVWGGQFGMLLKKRSLRNSKQDYKHSKK